MKRISMLCIAAICLSLGLAACGSSDEGSSSSEADSTSSSGGSIPSGAIKIGMPIALSGPINAYDGPMKTGAELAVEKINSKGGIDGHDLELVLADTKGEVAQGGTAALQVLNEGAQFAITTPDYDLGGAAARIATKEGLITISAAGDLRYGLDVSPYLFNTYPGVPTEGAVMAEYAYQDLGWKSAYTLVDTVIAHSKGACEAFESAFEARGGTITGTDTFDSSSESVAPQITRMRQAAAKTEGLVLCSLLPGGPSALRQIRAAGIDLPVILDQGFDTNAWEKGVPNVGEAYSVSVGIATPGEEPDKNAATLLGEAEKLTGEPTSYPLGVLTGASAVEAIADAVAETGTTEAGPIQEYFEQYKDHPLAVGPTTWTAQCHLRAGQPMLMAKIESDGLHYEKTVKAKEVPQPEC